MIFICKHIQVQTEDLFTDFQCFSMNETVIGRIISVDKDVVLSSCSSQYKPFVFSYELSPYHMKQRWSFDRSIQLGNCNRTLSIGIGLIVGKGEEIFLIGARFNTIDTDMSSGMGCQVEHLSYHELQLKVIRNLGMNREETACCLCKQVFVAGSQPRMMPYCQHSACTPCLKKLLASKGSPIVKCQHCGHQQILQESDLEYFPKNISLTKLLKEQSTNAINESQEFSSKGSLENTSQFVKEICEIHKKELEIICITDRIKLCLHCALFGKHKDHKFKTIAEAEAEIDLKKQQFSSFKTKKEALDMRLSSQEFKDSIVKKISDQKDRLVTDIKKKFAHLYENIRMAEKKAFEDVVKNFKTVYLRITSLIKQENDAQKKYKQWEQQCSQLFLKGDKCRTIEQKSAIYLGGPLEICSQGETHLKRIEMKGDSNLKAIESLISKIKVVQNTGIANSLFNYINVIYEETEEEKILDCISQETLTIRENSMNLDIPKQPRIQFSPDPLSITKISHSVTPKKRSTSKDKQSKVVEKKGLPKVANSEIQRNTIEKLIEEFCERDNLDTLDLTGYTLSDIEIYEILKYLKPIKKVRGLKLVKNKLTNDGLARILEYIPSVTNLNLASNQLSDEALTQLIGGRQKVPMLRIINISSNRINERRSKAAMEELKKQGVIVTI